eukprot:gene12745-14720_t
MSKVYPTSGDYGRGGDKVDMMVLDVEEEMKRFSNSNDELVKSLYGRNDRNQGNNRAELSNVSLTSQSMPLGSNQARIIPHNNNHGDPDEVIKLSHELAGNNEPDYKKIAEELKAQFDVLSQQIKDYQQINHKLTSKCNASETKVNELENKVDTLEEETQELRSNGAAGQPNTPGLYSVRNNNTNRNAQMNSDINKRTEQMRRALLSGENDEVAALSLNEARASRDYYKMFKAWAAQRLPFRSDIRTVQARFGTSVASYFVFQRFVFLKITAVALVMVAFTIYHLAVFYQPPDATLSGYVQGAGYLPRFMTFSSFREPESFVYSAVVVLTMVFITVFLCISIVAEHKNAITRDALDAENRAPFSKEVLCAWDMSLSNSLDIDNLKGTNEHTYLQLIEDSHESGQKKIRSRYESFVFIARRVLGIFLYLIVVSSSFSAIIYLTVYGSIISEEAKSIPGVNNIGTLIAPVALQFINAAVPVVLQAITLLEQWDSAQTELRFLLFRTYLSNTLNTLILTLSYIMLADPILLAEYPQLRKALELVESDTFSCRIDQAADGLFVLVGATWAIQLANFFGTPFAMKCLAYLRGKPWVKPEFNIAEAMVNKLSFLGIVFVAFPFAPLSMIFVPAYVFITFKFEKYVIKRFYAKPKRPFRGQQAALVYAIFYLCTYVLVGMSVSGYFITTKTMAKDCAIQDDYIHMCTDALDADNICEADTSNEYYKMWGKSGKYPANICTNSCGPFVGERSALSAFKDSITGTGTVSTIWDIIFVYPYVPWCAVIVLALVIATRVNLYEVSRYSSSNKERALESHIQGIEAEKKRQEKIILKLKAIEQEEQQDAEEDKKP